MPNGYVVISSREIGLGDALLWIVTRTYTHIFHHLLRAICYYTSKGIDLDKKKFWANSGFSCNVMVEKLSYCQSCNAVIGSLIYTHILLRHENICIHCTHTRRQTHKRLHHSVFSGIKRRQIKRSKPSFIFIPFSKGRDSLWGWMTLMVALYVFWPQSRLFVCSSQMEAKITFSPFTYVFH